MRPKDGSNLTCYGEEIFFGGVLKKSKENCLRESRPSEGEPKVCRVPFFSLWFVFFFFLVFSRFIFLLYLVFFSFSLSPSYIAFHLNSTLLSLQ